MPESLRYRLSVRLRDGKRSQVSTIDFIRRETVEMQLTQLLFKQNDYNCRALFEFTNELGELLAFRAYAYRSYAITLVETLATAS